MDVSEENNRPYMTGLGDMKGESIGAAPNGSQNQEIKSTQESVFTIFSDLPTEIRLQIWSLMDHKPRIIRWIRKNEMNVFSAPKKSTPLFEVCRESREAAIYYGSYMKLPGSSTDIWFSPIIDFLFFDPGWFDLVDTLHGPRVNPLESLKDFPELENVRNIMVHPNYTNNRKKPGVSFEKFTHLDRILVAADERSIGTQSKFMLGTVYDIKLYYVAFVKKKNPDVIIPSVAVGCLGWVGEERRKMHHGGGDNRQLVAVCDSPTRLMEHVDSVRKEEWKFIQENRSQSKFTLSLRLRHDGPDPSLRSPTKTHPTTSDLPSYDEAVFSADRPWLSNAKNSWGRRTWHKLGRRYQKLVRDPQRDE